MVSTQRCPHINENPRETESETINTDLAHLLCLLPLTVAKGH